MRFPFEQGRGGKVEYGDLSGEGGLGDTYGGDEVFESVGREGEGLFETRGEGTSGDL